MPIVFRLTTVQAVAAVTAYARENCPQLAADLDALGPTMIAHFVVGPEGVEVTCSPDSPGALDAAVYALNPPNPEDIN